MGGMWLLWLNALAAASASTVWALWAVKWTKRGGGLLAALYALSAVATLTVSIGYVTVLVIGDVTHVAVLARWAAFPALSAAALARLIELLRDERSQARVNHALGAAEEREDVRVRARAIEARDEAT